MTTHPSTAPTLSSLGTPRQALSDSASVHYPPPDEPILCFSDIRSRRPAHSNRASSARLTFASLSVSHPPIKHDTDQSTQSEHSKKSTHNPQSTEKVLKWIDGLPDGFQRRI